MSWIRIGTLMVVMAGTTAWAGPESPGTGPHGGVVLSLGPYRGEFRVWENFLEFFLYDAAGKAISTEQVTGTVEAIRVAPVKMTPAKGRRRVDFRAKGDRLRGDLALGAAESAELEVEIAIDSGRHRGKVTWTKSEDRSRLGDWSRPPW